MNILLMWSMGAANFVYTGAVLAALWTWFLVPLGVPNIGVAQAMGILCVSALFQLKSSYKSNEGKDVVDFSSILAYSIMVSILLGIGFILKHFI